MGHAEKHTADTQNTNPGGFHAIIGNPPFLSQLSASTAMNRGCAAITKQRIGKAASAYTDTAALFLADALTRLRPNGRVAFLLPQSFLASRDAQTIRTTISELHTLEHLWVSEEHAFEQALVSTCAPVVCNTPNANQPTTCAHSITFRESQPEPHNRAATQAGTWSHLTADARDLPRLSIDPTSTIQSIADATADFRDEYYGLRDFITQSTDLNDQSHPKLITTKMIDPATNRWGHTECRILKQSWLSPRVDRARMQSHGTLSDWIIKRLVPKVLIATQSVVIEAIADEQGHWLPCMPVISVMPKEPTGIWHLASALSSPIACLHAVRHYAGTAMTPDAIKLSAKQVLSLPAPEPGTSWDLGAMAFEHASASDSSTETLELLSTSGLHLCDAFALHNEERDVLMQWWLKRLTKTLTRS